MSFIGSARRWRPQRFDELIGQDHIRRTLSNALGASRVATAYLFSGTRGVGKTTTARILAKALNCESSDKPVPEPCNACASCEEVARGAHPDILEIDGATYTGIDNIRDLCEGLRYRPARGRYKTVIIDEVHQISRHAFNALLKTLEEPPPHVVFVFATTELQKVPDTILSRCQVFEFRRIAPGAIAAQLVRIVKEQGGSAEEGALRLLARMGEGSMRDAQSLLDQVVAFSPGKALTVEDVEGVLGVPSSEVYRNIVSAVAARDGRAALCELKGVFEAGHDLKFFCASLLEFLRDVMVLQVAGDGADLFDAAPEELEDRRVLAARLSFAQAHQAYAILQGAEAELRTTDHPRMALELALLRMCQIEPLADLGRLIERIESLGAPGASRSLGPAGGAGEGGSPPALARPPAREGAGGPPGGRAPRGGERPEGPAGRATVAQAAPAPWDPVQARRVWGEAVQSLRPTRQALFEGAEVDVAAEGQIHLHVRAGNGHAQTLDLVREMLPALEAYFAANAPWPVRLVLEAPARAGRAGEAAPEEREHRRQEEQAAIQEVVDLFNGRIVDIRPLRSRRAGAPAGRGSAGGEGAPGVGPQEDPEGGPSQGESEC